MLYDSYSMLLKCPKEAGFASGKILWYQFPAMPTHLSTSVATASAVAAAASAAASSAAAAASAAATALRVASSLLLEEASDDPRESPPPPEQSREHVSRKRRVTADTQDIYLKLL